MYSSKPTLIHTSGILYNEQIGLLINSNCRLADSGTRLIFNTFLYGQIPLGNILYYASPSLYIYVVYRQIE